jgi:hypothetical protein
LIRFYEVGSSEAHSQHPCQLVQREKDSKHAKELNSALSWEKRKACRWKNVERRKRAWKSERCEEEPRGD